MPAARRTASLQIVAGAPAWYHPGRSGTIQMGPQNKLAYFGEVHPRVLAAMDVKGPLVAFEVVLNAIPVPKVKKCNACGAQCVRSSARVARLCLCR